MKDLKKHIKEKTKVYSLEHGVGEILAIYNLYDGVNDYIEVNFSKSGIIKLFPLNSKNDLRLVSNKVELSSTLKKLATKIVDTDYLSNQTGQKRFGVDIDLDHLTNMIAQLAGRLDLKTLEKKQLSRCVASLVLEVSHVFKIDNKKAKEVVIDHMRIV